MPLPLTIQRKEIKYMSQNKGYKTEMTGPHAFQGDAVQKKRTIISHYVILGRSRSTGFVCSERGLKITQG